MSDCVEATALIHEELREIARSAAAYWEKHYYGNRSEQALRLAIQQTILNTGRVPESIMAELLRHVNEEIAGHSIT